MRYPRNMYYLGYKIRSNYNARTSNVSDKMRYWSIESVHVGVKLLYDNDFIYIYIYIYIMTKQRMIKSWLFVDWNDTAYSHSWDHVNLVWHCWFLEFVVESANLCYGLPCMCWFLGIFSSQLIDASMDCRFWFSLLGIKITLALVRNW